MQLHSGVVSAHSDGAGAGAQFTISLPRIAAGGGEANESVAESSPVAALGPANVLVVDDNEDAAEVLTYLVESAGHHVSVAHSAKEALEALGCSVPAVIFLDIGLPDIDGFELAKRIRFMRALTGVFIVAVTGYGQAHDKERAFAADFDRHLVKPVDVESVLNVVDTRPQLVPPSVASAN